MLDALTSAFGPATVGPASGRPNHQQADFAGDRLGVRHQAQVLILDEGDEVELLVAHRRVPEVEDDKADRPGAKTTG